jgi:hypothetical protein
MVDHPEYLSKWIDPARLSSNFKKLRQASLNGGFTISETFKTATYLEALARKKYGLRLEKEHLTQAMSAPRSLRKQQKILWKKTTTPKKRTSAWKDGLDDLLSSHSSLRDAQHHSSQLKQILEAMSEAARHSFFNTPEFLQLALNLPKSQLATGTSANPIPIAKIPAQVQQSQHLEVTDPLSQEFEAFFKTCKKKMPKASRQSALRAFDGLKHWDSKSILLRTFQMLRTASKNLSATRIEYNPYDESSLKKAIRQRHGSSAISKLELQYLQMQMAKERDLAFEAYKERGGDLSFPAFLEVTYKVWNDEEELLGNDKLFWAEVVKYGNRYRSWSKVCDRPGPLASDFKGFN